MHVALSVDTYGTVARSSCCAAAGVRGLAADAVRGIAFGGDTEGAHATFGGSLAYMGAFRV